MRRDVEVEYSSVNVCVSERVSEMTGVPLVRGNGARDPSRPDAAPRNESAHHHHLLYRVPTSCACHRQLDISDPRSARSIIYLSFSFRLVCTKCTRKNRNCNQS